MKKLSLLMLFLSLVLAIQTWAGEFRMSSSVTAINVAYRNGEIDIATYAIEKLKALNAPEKVSARFQRGGTTLIAPSRETTILIHVAIENLKSYTSEDQEFVRTLRARPAGLDKSHSTTNFKFHYTTTDATNKVDATDTDGDGVPDYVESMAEVFENVRTVEVTNMGYRAPYKDPADAAHGGDDKFDVYILNLAGSYGEEVPDGAAGGTDDGNGQYAFIRMENDYSGFSGTALDNVKVTAAHEYNHAIQDAYNSSFYSTGSWIYENTSTWMEDQVYDAIDDNRQYLKGANGFFANPQISMDSKTNDYRGWIHHEFLGKKFAPVLIRYIWEALDPVGKNDGMVALISVLKDKYSTKMQNTYVEFVGHNYAKTWYKDSGEYSKADYNTKVENSAAPHKLDYSTATSHEVEVTGVDVDHAAGKYYKFVPGDDIDEPAILSLEFEAAAEDVVGAVAIRKKKDGKYVEYPFTFGTTTKTGECGVPDFHKDYTEYVILALSNYSQANDAPNITYRGSLEKGFTFCIDDTGSMGSAISSAKAVAKKVLSDNKAAGIKRMYTLISFKDGAGTLRGQSKDEDRMTALIDALGASGGSGTPESSLTAIRQACDLSPYSDILMMTDAPSNSYGVDNTYATMGEVVETAFKVVETGCRLNVIYYNTDRSTTSRSNDGGLIRRTVDTRDPAYGEGYSLVCAKSGGLFFDNTANTETAVEMILLTGGSDSTIAFYNDKPATSSSSTRAETFAYTVPVDSSVSRLQLAVNPDDDGVTATMSVTNPSGAVVTNDTEGVTVLNTGGTTYYTIESPALATGDWKVSINSDGAFHFSADAITSNAMQYTGDTTVGLGKTLSLSCSFDSPVSGASFQLMTLDGSSHVDISLTSSDNLTYTGEYTVNTLATYRFVALGSDSFMRTEAAEIKVVDVDVTATDDISVIKNFMNNKSVVVQHVLTVKNLGSSEQTFSLYAASSKAWADVSGIPASVTLTAGESVAYTVDVTIPADAESGDVETISFQAVNESDKFINDTVSTNVTISDVEPTEIDAKTIKITYDSSKQYSGTVSIKNAELPMSAPDAGISADDAIIVNIDGVEFACDNGEWQTKGDGEDAKYTFKSVKAPKRADGDEAVNGEFTLILDFSKDVWHFSLKNADLSAVDNSSGIYVVLFVNDDMYGDNYTMDENTKFSFDGKKDTTTDGTTTGSSLGTFDFGEKAKVSITYDSRKPTKGSIVIKGGPNDLVTSLDPSARSVQVSIDDTNFWLGTFEQKKEGVYIYKSAKKTLPIISMVIDQTEKKQTWMLSIKGQDTSTLNFLDGIEVYMNIGSYYDASKILNGTRKSQWFYKQSKEK